MIINHNMGAANAMRQMGVNQTNASKSMEKLSSGLRINKAGDDAAGLAISEKMRGQIRGLDQASRNAQDGISLIQTAEGGLNETHSILQRMRELAVQGATDTNEAVDRDAIQTEMNQLTQEINRISDTTQFNNKKLLGGSFSAELQIGANENQHLAISVRDMSATGSVLNLGSSATNAASVKEVAVVKEATAGTLPSSGVNVSGYTQSDNLDIKIKATGEGDGSGTSATFDVTINGVTKSVTADTNAATGAITLDATKFDNFDAGQNIVIIPAEDWAMNDEFNVKIEGKTDTVTGPSVSTYSDAKGSITNIDNAIKEVSKERSTIGAWQNRLEHTIANLGTSSENLTSAESRIRDVDMAKEMSEFSKNNILSQAAQAMLAQANQQPQQVLQLLR